jgi:hypothetical protein
MGDLVSNTKWNMGGCRAEFFAAVEVLVGTEGRRQRRIIKWWQRWCRPLGLTPLARNPGLLIPKVYGFLIRNEECKRYWPATKQWMRENGYDSWGYDEFDYTDPSTWPLVVEALDKGYDPLIDPRIKRAEIIELTPEVLANAQEEILE